MRFRRDRRHFAAAVRAWFCSLKKQNQIAILVGLAHIGAILWMSVDYCLTDHPKNRRPVIVRTIRPQTAPIHIASAPKPETAPIAFPKALPQQPKARTTPSPSASVSERPIPASSKTKKSTAVLTRSGKKTVSSPIQPKKAAAETLRKIEEEFDAIALQPSSSRASSTEIKLPAVLQSKTTALRASIDETITKSSIPSTYHLSLIDLLQSSLQLPELGDVRVKIVLSAPGAFSLIQILDAKSEKNAQWLKNQLPLLPLPCFNDFGIVDAILEFTITFRNVENS